MEFIRGAYNLVGQCGCVATIGNFDGVHLGHQAVIKQILARAHNLALASVVIIFEPHPLEVVAPTQAPARITSLRDKLYQLERLGVDKVLCLQFNTNLQNLKAGEFVRQLLVDGLNVHHFVVGDDFRFGHQRQGDFEFLQAQSQVYGFGLEKTRSFTIESVRVSSTEVRQALKNNDLSAVYTLLGRPFSISGKVIKGKQLGRTLGVPTANIGLPCKPLIIHGVFAVKVLGIANQAYFGVANIGMRPTLGGVKPALEVHVFDFSGNLYGARLSVEFCHFIRAEKKFANLAKLTDQIHRDARQAQTYFNLI